jgi:hypothetical protein
MSIDALATASRTDAAKPPCDQAEQSGSASRDSDTVRFWLLVTRAGLTERGAMRRAALLELP